MKRAKQLKRQRNFDSKIAHQLKTSSHATEEISKLRQSSNNKNNFNSSVEISEYDNSKVGVQVYCNLLGDPVTSPKRIKTTN